MDSYQRYAAAAGQALSDASFKRDQMFYDANENVEKQEEKNSKIDAVTEPFSFELSKEGLQSLGLRAMKKLGLKKSAEAIENVRKDGIIKGGIKTLRKQFQDMQAEQKQAPTSEDTTPADNSKAYARNQPELDLDNMNTKEDLIDAEDNLRARYNNMDADSQNIIDAKIASDNEMIQNPSDLDGLRNNLGVIEGHIKDQEANPSTEFKDPDLFNPNPAKQSPDNVMNDAKIYARNQPELDIDSLKSGQDVKDASNNLRMRLNNMDPDTRDAVKAKFAQDPEKINNPSTLEDYKNNLGVMESHIKDAEADPKTTFSDPDLFNPNPVDNSGPVSIQRGLDPRLAGVDDENILSLQRPTSIYQNVKNNIIGQGLPDDVQQQVNTVKTVNNAAKKAQADFQKTQQKIISQSGGEGEGDLGEEVGETLEKEGPELAEEDAALGGPEDLVGDVITAAIGTASLLSTVFGNKINHPEIEAPIIRAQAGLGLLPQ